MSHATPGCTGPAGATPSTGHTAPAGGPANVCRRATGAGVSELGVAVVADLSARRAARPAADADPRATAAVVRGPAAHAGEDPGTGAAPSGLPHRSLDPRAASQGDPSAVRDSVSPQSCLETADRPRLAVPATRAVRDGEALDENPLHDVAPRSSSSLSRGAGDPASRTGRVALPLLANPRPDRPRVKHSKHDRCAGRLERVRAETFLEECRPRGFGRTHRSPGDSVSGAPIRTARAGCGLPRCYASCGAETGETSLMESGLGGSASRRNGRGAAETPAGRLI